MKKDILSMNQKERQRYHLLQMVLDGKSTLKDTTERMGVSYRHAKRLKKKLKPQGTKGLSQGEKPRHVQLLKRNGFIWHQQLRGDIFTKQLRGHID
jgi:transposase